MQLLSVQNLTKHYADKILFTDASFNLNTTDRAAIVGVNGSGKTTLLKIITGQETPDSGEILHNANCRVAWLPQNPVMAEPTTVLDYLFQSESPTMRLLQDYENAVLTLTRNPTDPAAQTQMEMLNQRMEAENGWAAEANAKAILTRLGIAEFDSPLGKLSGGQRRRVALARVLLDPADLLILDEPTNHIDPETIIWLENYLKNINSAILMVTHDRYFLDRVVSRIIEIEDGRIYNHRGNYSLYLENKANREATNQKLAVDQRSFLQKELEWLHRAPMARGGKQKARIQRAEAMLDESGATSSAALNISAATRRTGKQIIELQNVSKQFDDTPLITNFSYIVNKGAKLGIIGPNGTGKSTLLNLIAGRIEPDSGTIITGATIHLGYYDQEGAALDEDQRVIDNVTDVASVIQTANGDSITAAQMLERFQFSRKVQWSYIGTLSGGERRRLYLLRTLMMAPNVLLLDEPTNDLDIQTLSILEDYLDSFQGVVIAVSHDRYFLDRTVEHIFAFEGGGVIKQYPGNYTAYQAQKIIAPNPEPSNQKTGPAKTESTTSNRPRRISFNEKRELAEIEGRITALEAEKELLTEKINRAGSDYQQLNKHSEALIRLEGELETLMERWAELAEIAEG